jgi:uncharacterized membrane protein
MMVESMAPASFPAGFSKNRIEALTDGIFAIAMTLLVLGIEVPQMFPLIPLHTLFESLFPDIIHYVISFLALAVIWVLHHQQFHYIRSIDHTLLWLNIVWLMLVCLVPFSTSLADTYSGVKFANMPFAINLLLISLILFAQWQHAVKHRELVIPELTRETTILERNRNVVILTITFFGSVLAFISIVEGIIVYLLIPVLHALFPRIDRGVKHSFIKKSP